MFLKKNRVFSVFIIFIVLFLILIIVKNIYILFFVKVKTEFAKIDTFNKFIDTNVLVLRDEEILKNDGILRVVCKDKTRVSNNQVICKIYNSESDVPKNSVHNHGIVDMVDINDKINMSVRNLIHNNKIDNELEYLLKSKEEFLNGEKIEENTEENDYGIDVRSKHNGIFSCFTDGFEGVLNTKISDESIKKLNFNNYKFPKECEKSIFGKIIVNNKCLLLCTLDRGSSLENRKFRIFFQFDSEGIVCDLLKIIQLENGKKIAVFSTDVNENLINSRFENAKIRIESIEGIKINKKCIHEYDGQRGIFILDKKIVKFKFIDVIYDGDDFVLCNYGQDPEFLNENDLLIISGENLYDGKVLMF